MKFITIVGPHAVGKMTVGEELSKLTGFPLFHNHTTIDLVLKYMTWDEGFDLVLKFREDIMRRVASLQKPGLIYTMIWDFDSRGDWDHIQKNDDIFKDGERYYVELYSNLETRQKRNITENRLQKKWTKRNLEWSQKEIVSSMSRHRMTSNETEVPYKNYLKIDNTNLTPEEVAKIIYKYFSF
jgi:adenylate kinase family enzyme